MKTIISEILSSVRYKPSRHEFCILAHQMKLNVAVIKRITGIHNRTLYNLLKEEKKESRLFYPRLEPSQIEVIKQFIHTFNKIKGAGF